MCQCGCRDGVAVGPSTDEAARAQGYPATPVTATPTRRVHLVEPCTGDCLPHRGYDLPPSVPWQRRARFHAAIGGCLTPKGDNLVDFTRASRRAHGHGEGNLVRARSNFLVCPNVAGVHPCHYHFTLKKGSWSGRGSCLVKFPTGLHLHRKHTHHSFKEAGGGGLARSRCVLRVVQGTWVPTLV